VTRGLGSILSSANVISSNELAQSSAVANSDLSTTAFSIAVLKKLMNVNAVFEQKIYLEAICYLTKINQQKSGPLFNFEETRLNEFLLKTRFVKLA